MNDHERTVGEARDNMAEFDQRRDLERWLQNYVHPELGVPQAYWVAVTKDRRRWKAEYGLIGSDQASAWCYSDPGAPEPPIFDFRKPKPAPVKARWQVPPARTVPSFEQHMSEAARQIAEAFAVPDHFWTTSTTPIDTGHFPAEGLTIEKLFAAVKDLPETRHAPPHARHILGYEPRELMYEERSMSWSISYGYRASLNPHAMVQLIDAAPRLSDQHKAELARLEVPELEEIKKPAPTPSKRNQP